MFKTKPVKNNYGGYWFNHEENPDEQANIAIQFADELIKQLKSK